MKQENFYFKSTVFLIELIKENSRVQYLLELFFIDVMYKFMNETLIYVLVQKYAYCMFFMCKIHMYSFS